jgi:hypothetical protein
LSLVSLAHASALSSFAVPQKGLFLTLEIACKGGGDTEI